jgi:P4 family phage/plasmid primase-like protien
LRSFYQTLIFANSYRKLLGHALIGENPEKLIIFVYGPHDTGKSTLLNGIKGALGDYYGTVDINLFKPKDLNPGLIRAVPKRIVGMSEVDNNKMEASTIKRLTGNDEIAAEWKNSNDIFTGRPQFTPLIACNNEPEITNADEALRERVLILPFENTIPSSERNHDKHDSIARESGPAVLSWLVEGWRMYKREGLKRRDWPASIRKLSGEVVSHFNATQMFIHEELEKYTQSPEGQKAWEAAKRSAKRNGRSAPSPADWPKEWTPVIANVFQSYQNWCGDMGIPHVGKIQFGKDLGVLTGQRKMDGGSPKVYMGVRWRNNV